MSDKATALKKAILTWARANLQSTWIPARQLSYRIYIFIREWRDILPFGHIKVLGFNCVIICVVGTWAWQLIYRQIKYHRAFYGSISSIVKKNDFRTVKEVHYKRNIFPKSSSFKEFLSPCRNPSYMKQGQHNEHLSLPLPWQHSKLF